MISEGLCNTEDWSNDTENSALITGTVKHVFKIVIIFYKITIFTVFDLKNAVLVSIRLLLKTIKFYQTYKHQSQWLHFKFSFGEITNIFSQKIN